MKIGQYVNAAIHSPISYNALAVPSQAVINTGLRQVVAVALGGGRFEIRDVKLGPYADGYYEVTEGLNEGDTIVTSGQFLIDSDANLKSAGASLTAGIPETKNVTMGNEGTKKREARSKKPEMKKGMMSMDGMDMPGMTMAKDSSREN